MDPVVDSCGQYFDRGSSKKKLDTFLIFFQCYLFGKRRPLPRKAYECAHTRERQFRENLGEGASVEDGEEEEEVAKSKPEEERDFEAAKHMFIRRAEQLRPTERLPSPSQLDFNGATLMRVMGG
eukprot:Em0024g36a